MESVQHRKTSITGRILIIAIIFLTVTLIAQAIVSTIRAHTAVVDLMEMRMLNIAQSAAAQISGEDMEALDGNVTDSEKPEFHRIVDVMNVFEKNVTLEYIYGVKKLRGGYGVVVEDDLEGEDEFGEPISETPAMVEAMAGTPTVEKDVYEDRWGRVYTAFAPVFNEKKEVTGVIGVDFNADQYDSKSTSQDILIIIVCAAALVGSFLTVFFITGRARYEVRFRQQESEDLRQMKEAVDGANQAKSHFLDHISQETRTPIHTILDTNEKILETTHVERTVVCANGIHQAGEQLMTMVNNVLEYSSIEADRVTYEKKEYDLVPFIYDIVNTIRPKIEEKGLGFYVNVDEVLPRHLFGDYVHISQCLMNLLTNAVKFTEEGEITLSVFMIRRTQLRAYIRFSVEDTGAGIPEEDRERLFEPFERVESTNGKFSIEEGTGLGLAVVQSLLRHMDSSLDVESLLGAGSVFSFTIEQGVRKEDAVGDLDEEISNLNRM